MTFRPFLLHQHRFHHQARWLMLGVVLLSSVGPALYASAADGGNIFFFAAASRLGWLVLAGGWCWVFWRHFLKRHHTFGKILRSWRSHYFFLTLIQPMDVIFTVLAVRFIDVSTVSVLTQSWPLLFMMAMLFAFRASGRDKRLTLTCGLIAFAGCALVVWGQVGTGTLYAAGGGWGTAAGIGFSLLASFFLSWQAYRLLWIGHKIIGNDKLKPNETLAVQVFGAVFALGVNFLLYAIVGLLSAGFGAAASFATTDLASAAFFWGLIGFFICLFWTKANLVEHNPSVNLLLYLAPVMSLCWLLLWQKVDVANLWLVGLGTLMVTLAGILSHFRHPHPRHRHRPL